MENSKKPYQSKSIILNALMGVIMAVAAFYPPAKLVGDFITNHALEIGVGWSMLNVILRAISKDKIVLTD